MSEDRLSTRDVLEMTGVTARQLQWWDEKGVVVPQREGRNRIYDAAFPDCLRDIDTAISALHASGARRIVLAGQSLGGLAALVYSVQHPDLAGVIALAPAGAPSRLARNPRVAQSIAKARQMLAAGQGGQRTDRKSVV